MKKLLLLLGLLMISDLFGQSKCDSLFTLANQVYEERGPKDAISIYTKIIALKCEKLSMAYNNRGSLYNEMKDYKTAISDFENALSLDSQNHSALANESTSYNMLDNSQKATELIDKAIKFAPDFFQYYRLRGDVKYSEEKFDSAIINYKLCLALKPDYIELYSLIANVYEDKNKVAIRKANRNSDPSTAALTGEVLSNSFYKNRDSAIAILKLMVNNFPERKFLILSRADFYRRNFLYDEAIADYLQGLKYYKGEDKYEWLCNLAFCYDGKGDNDNALRYYTQSIEDTPNSIAYANRGRKYRKMKKLKGSIEDEENVIKLDPTYAQAYLIIGNCYLDMKQPQKAMTYFKRGLAQNPHGEIKDLLKIQMSKIESKK